MEEAFRIGEEYYGVPRLLDPKDVASKPDEHSIMTYVSMFKQKQVRCSLI